MKARRVILVALGAVVLAGLATGAWRETNWLVWVPVWVLCYCIGWLAAPR